MALNIYLLLFARLGILLGMYSLGRLIFFVYCYSRFETSSLYEIVLAFGKGVRYDFAAIVMVNFINIILSLIPIKQWQESALYQKILKNLFIIVNIPFLVLNFVDLELYRITSRRFTFDHLMLTEDMKQQLSQMAVHFWYISLIIFAVIYLIAKIYPSEIKKWEDVKLDSFSSSGLSLLVVLSFLATANLNVDGAALKSSQAFEFSTDDLGFMALNAPFSVIESFGGRKIEKHKEIQVSQNPIKELYEKKNAEKLLRHFDRLGDNIVVIILESFNQEYMGKGNKYEGYTPFLDKLAKKSLSFPKSYANGRRSIDAIPSILFGIPYLMNHSLIFSQYEDSGYESLASVLKKQGYSTSFFHGGYNGTMGFERFTLANGFDHYIGLDEYPESQRDFDGDWGIWDEKFLKFFADELGKQGEPFLGSVFTLSSHQPYKIPPSFTPLIESRSNGQLKSHPELDIKSALKKNGESEIYPTILYSDWSLEQFFKYAKTKSWYDHTLFIISADHTSLSYNPAYQSTPGKYQIPILFYHPTVDLGKRSRDVVQQVDIFPSVLDYLGLPLCSGPLFGKSVFREGKGHALNLTGGVYRYILDDYFVEWAPGDKMHYFKNLPQQEKEPLLPLPEGYKEDAHLMKLLIQYHDEGLEGLRSEGRGHDHLYLKDCR
ncbi:MAG: LTA synthase family protein [Halobacteriovoraceae bacterium]|nr:LTA synthase family protein [Halobacteriovoraceae bacterium]